MRAPAAVDRVTPAPWIPAGVGLYALSGGLVTLVGWSTNRPRLTDWYANGISMMPNTAVAAMSAGAALLLLALGYRRVVFVLGILTGLIGAATLFEYLATIDLGIDTLLIYPEWGQRGTLALGRMGPPASAATTILGTSLTLATLGLRSRKAAAMGGMLVAGIAMLSIIGYLFDVNTLYSLPRLTTIALQTATILLALGAGLVSAIPDAQPMRTLRGNTSDAVLIRRALPFVLILPIVLGWLRLEGEQAGLFETAFGTAFLVLMLIVMLTGVLWWAAAAVRAHARPIRESRERLEGVLACISDQFQTVDRNWRITYHNAAMRRALAMQGIDADATIGTNLFDLFPDNLETPGRKALRQSMEQRIEVDYETYFEPWQRWYAVRASPTPDGGLAILSQDITGRKQAEEALHRLAADLREADRRKDEFLATLAHELRNPLAPVRNSLEIMKRAEGNASLIEHARSTMERQMAHMVRLIDDLLDVSRIARDKLQLRKEGVELAPVIQHEVESCRPLATASSHELILSLPQEPVYLNADPVRLAQVFGNLLNNACRYTRPGGLIRVTAERQDGDVVVTVQDTGIGIPPEMLPRIFEMFTQVDRTLERSQGGLGIGLSLVKRLVELHGGTITARSDGQGRGSAFVVRLPVLIEKPAPQNAAERGGETVTATVRRILVVDDNRDAATSLATLLKMTGDETLTAHDGVEAVEKAAAHKPDVILLDIGVPRMNGYDACRAIREQPGGRNILMVALTGWGQEEDRRRSKEAGFDGHLVKPVDYAALMQLLATASEARR